MLVIGHSDVQGVCAGPPTLGRFLPAPPGSVCVLRDGTRGNNIPDPLCTLRTGGRAWRHHTRETWLRRCGDLAGPALLPSGDRAGPWPSVVSDGMEFPGTVPWRGLVWHLFLGWAPLWCGPFRPLSRGHFQGPGLRASWAPCLAGCRTTSPARVCRGDLAPAPSRHRPGPQGTGTECPQGHLPPSASASGPETAFSAFLRPARPPASRAAADQPPGAWPRVLKWPETSVWLRLYVLQIFYFAK